MEFQNSGGDEHVIVVREEILGLTPQACNESDIISDEVKDSVGLKKWTEENMDLALDALQSRSMTLAKASDIYGIPSSTLWKRAHRMGIDTPKSCSVLANKASKAIDVSSDRGKGTIGQKTWTQEDMELALDALRSHNMSLTKAAATYGIPSATLWQRAHRMGIDTPKMESPLKSWTEENLNNALEALRSGTISANKASKAYSIPSSTLYKIARREGIKLTAPFNAAPTTWSPEDLKQALEGIRSGQISVQRASTEFGIPAGTLYGRCKKERIELSRINLTPTPWSEDAMGEALEAVTVGQMSINQAAIQFNIPYSSLYGRFRRGKQKFDRHYTNETAHSPTPTSNTQMMFVPNPQHNQHTTPQQSEQYSPQHHPIYQYLQHNIS